MEQTELEEKAEEYAQNCKYVETDYFVNKIAKIKAIFLDGLAEGRKEKELSYEVEEVTKVELNKCNTIEDKMEWLGKVLGQAIFKNDMNYAVWVNVQKNNIIEHLEKENAELKAKYESYLRSHTITCGMTEEEIIEMRKENAELKEDLQTAISANQQWLKRDTRLEEQIEKMENCWNCKFFKEKKYQACIDRKKNNTKCCAFYKWELAE